MSVTLRFKILDALRADASGNIAKAKANIEVYLENPVGIGEHPQHLEEMDKFVEKLATANDKLENLKEFYKYNYGN